MSSDDDGCGIGDNQRGSLASPVPPSAGGLVPDSPRFDDAGEKRLSENGVASNTTATEIANTDERVRSVLYSDVSTLTDHFCSWDLAC